MPGDTILKVKTSGKIEGYLADILRLENVMMQAPLWIPGAALIKECREARLLIGDLKARLERKLIVTLIGPSGSGKSTLLNALSGVDDLSETGSARPTTRKAILFSKNRSDMESIVEDLGNTRVEMRSNSDAAFLENMVLVDTPDTDSVHLDEHRNLLHGIIALSDVLICLFDAENPKRKDHTDYLASYIRRFDGDSLLVVLNKCDRMEKEELQERIVPEFKKYIQNSWEKPVTELFCISGRSHLYNPRWDPSVLPRHDFDQFDGLEKMIRKAFTREGFCFDRRLKNVIELWDYPFSRVQTEASRDREDLASAMERIRDIERKAADCAIATMATTDAQPLFSVSTRMYQELIQRWTGPVGWLIAVWCRLLAFGSGIASLLRFRKPVRRIKDWIADSRRQDTAVRNNPGLNANETGSRALWEYRLTMVKHWGDIAAALIQGRFDPSVRQIESAVKGREGMEDRFSWTWNAALEDEVRRIAHNLSGFFLQLLFNLPVLGIATYAAWVTVRDFIQGTILPLDFFLHAFFTIGITLFLSFFVFQVLVRFASRNRRIEARALQTVTRMTHSDDWMQESVVAKQIAAVLSLPKNP